MAQFVQLEQGIVQVLELEVGGQQAACHIVRRVLDRTEIVDLVGVRHNDHAAGVLTVVRLTPVQPRVRRFSSAWFTVRPRSSRYFLT